MSEEFTAATPPEAEICDAFTAGALAALQELCQLEGVVIPLAEDQPASCLATDELVIARVKLLRELPGRLSLLLPAGVLERLAQRYLPPGTELEQELLNDVAGELSNVIAGQGKTALKGTDFHFLLSTPLVTRATAAPPRSPSERVLAIASEVGEFAIRVALAACPSAAFLTGE